MPAIALVYSTQSSNPIAPFSVIPAILVLVITFLASPHHFPPLMIFPTITLKHVQNSLPLGTTLLLLALHPHELSPLILAKMWLLSPHNLFRLSLRPTFFVNLPPHLSLALHPFPLVVVPPRSIHPLFFHWILPQNPEVNQLTYCTFTSPTLTSFVSL